MAINNPLSNLFGKSPIRPIQQHMTVITDCATKLRQLFDSAAAGDWETTQRVHKAICEDENSADKLKRELRQQLPKGLFMPIDRRDLLKLLSKQDHIAGHCQDIAHLVISRKITIPAPLQDKMNELVDSAIATTRQALTAINELDELLETGFSGREVEFVESLISKLDDMEDTTDDLEQEIKNQLFEIEAEMPPVNVMFLYQLIDLVGNISDDAENVGDCLHQMLAR